MDKLKDYIMRLHRVVVNGIPSAYVNYYKKGSIFDYVRRNKNPLHKQRTNYNNTNRIITVLKQLKIGQETIDLLLVNYIDLFLMDYNKFISKLRYADLSEVSFSIIIISI